MGVRVKPLVWEPSPDPMGHDHWVASALGGDYHMAPDEDSPGILSALIEDDGYVTVFPPLKQSEGGE